MQRLLSFVLVLLLAGCSATGTRFKDLPSDAFGDKARIVVFRPDSFVAKAKCFNVLVDGTDIGKLKNGGFMQYWVSPGLHAVTVPVPGGELHDLIAGQGRVETTVDLKAGETSYVKLTVELGGSSGYHAPHTIAMSFHHTLTNVSSADAYSELADLRQSDQSYTCL